MIRVLHTVQPSFTKSNPFVNLLVNNLPGNVESQWFSWRRALLGRYDILHFQWPEKLVQSDRMLRRFLKHLGVLAILARTRVMKTPMIITLHNLQSHEGMTALEGRLLRRIYARTALLVTLTDAVAPPEEFTCPVITIPHGDYSQVSQCGSSVTSRTRSILSFGLIREYKNTPALLASFGELVSDPHFEDASLTITGKPWSAALRESIEQAATGIGSVELRLAALEDHELAELICSSALVVLPYTQLYNSGAIFLALTLGTPVLVPSTPTTRALVNEFGEDWVILYEGSFGVGALATALGRVDTMAPEARPDLSNRDWRMLGERYGEAYASLL